MMSMIFFSNKTVGTKKILDILDVVIGSLLWNS